MQQKVTVPAWSSTSLYLLLLSFSPVQLCLIVLSALFSLPPSWVCLLFFPFPSFLFPFPHCIISLTHYHSVDMCDSASKTVCGLHPILSLSSFFANVIVQEGLRALEYREERGGGPQARICKSRDKSCCVVFAASPEWSNNKGRILWVCLEPETYSRFLNMNWGSDECLTKEGGENVWERVNRRWGVW